MTLMMRQMSRRIKMHRINDIGNKFCKSFLKLLPDSLPKLCSHAELRTSARNFLFLMTKGHRLPSNILISRGCQLCKLV